MPRSMVMPLAMLLIPGPEFPPPRTAMCQSPAPEPAAVRAVMAVESSCVVRGWKKHQGRRRALPDQ